jgi:hypothetical protein
MEINRHISMPQITWIVGTLIGLAMAVFVGSAVGNADFSFVSIILGVGIGVGTFLVLGKHYWILIPFSLGASFPALPVGGRSAEFSELAIAGCSLFFLLRVATRKEKLFVFRRVNIPILLFIAWVAMVFALNPVGLAAMGSQVGGGRFYLKIALAFAAYLILSNREYSERDIRWVFGSLVFGAFFSLIYGFISYSLVGPTINPVSGMVAEEFYTWHQLLALPPLTITFLIFARWSPREVFSLQKAWLFLAYFLCLILVLFSGKRMAIAAMLLTPLVGAFLYRQPIYILVGVVLVTASLGIAVAGHGQLFQLPIVAQRTLSFLPGDWDAGLADLRGGSDDWRAELRNYAWQAVKKEPLIGKGFGVDLQEAVTAIGMAQTGGSMDIRTAEFAIGRAWHNIWFGYAADFGIPLSIIQAVIFCWIFVLTTKVFRFYGNQSLFGVFALYLLFYTFRDLIASHTSGQTASDAYNRWWMYGLIVALYLKTSIHAGRPKAVRKQTDTHASATPALRMQLNRH